MRTSRQLAASIPITGDSRFRIEMTASCRDCDPIPKVENAGAVIVENGVLVQVMHNGLRVIAGGYCGEWMQDLIRRLRGHHEPQEELIFHMLLPHIAEQATMIEVGGFWSYYSLWFVQHHPQRRAIVIEPDPNYIEIGRKNASLNGASIEFVPGFIGPESRSEAPFQTQSAGIVPLRMIDVAAFMDECGIDRLDILHCDAHGAEVDLLASCEGLLRDGRIRFMVLSTHAEAITGDPLTHQRCLDCVQTLGGQILAEHDVHESFSGDGLIVAHFGSQPVGWGHPTMSYNRSSRSLFRSSAFELALARAEIDRLRTRRYLTRWLALAKSLWPA
jgi:FkbM family methyltransferase